MAETKTDCAKKIDNQLKSEIQAQHDLKQTESTEKNVLPTAEDVQEEKIRQNLLEDVEHFKADKLQNVKTREPASSAEVAKVEMAKTTSVKEVTTFDKSQLKHVEVTESIVLPTEEDIKSENKEKELKSSIEGFNKESLAHAETVEKNTLPSKEVIQEEKASA